MIITLANAWLEQAPPQPSDAALEAAWCTLEQRRFAALRSALMRHGGLAPADHVCGLMRAHWAQPLSRVARWIAARDVVSVTRYGQIWLALFQFERPSLDLVPAAVDVIRTLRPVYDDWELAEWFVRPSDLLAGNCPASRLTCDPRAVKEAACRDRFINRW